MLDTRAWNPLKRAYRGAVESMRAQADLLQEPAISPAFDVVRSVRAIPWDSYENAMLEPWTRIAATMLERSRRAELGTARKDAAAVEAEASLADQLAVEWLETRGLELVQNQVRRAKSGVQDILQQAIVEAWDIPRIVKATRGQIGLHPRDRKALSSFQSRMKRLGLTERQVAQRVERYRSQLLNQRAELIARTEVVAAREQGRFHAWKEMQQDGDLTVRASRRWMLGGNPCEICVSLAALGPVKLNRPFSSEFGTWWAPTAHPNCDCTTELVTR